MTLHEPLLELVPAMQAIKVFAGFQLDYIAQDPGEKDAEQIVCKKSAKLPHVMSIQLLFSLAWQI